MTIDRAKRSFLGLIFITASACDSKVAAPVVSVSTPKLYWDLSQDNYITRVNWPKDELFDGWQIDGPGVVRIRLRGGVENDIKFYSILLKRDGHRLKNVRINLEQGTVATVYADAMKLAKDWGISDTNDIQLFKDTNAIGIERDGKGVYNVGVDKDAIQGRGIDIRKSFDSASGKPYFALFGFGFYPDFDAAKTQAQRDSLINEPLP